MSTEKQIPYKIYLEESEMPQNWYNVRADMKNKPAPMLNPGTHEPMTAEELSGVFCADLVAQELDNDTAYIPIPEEIHPAFLVVLHYHLSDREPEVISPYVYQAGNRWYVHRILLGQQS